MMADERAASFAFSCFCTEHFSARRLSADFDSYISPFRGGGGPVGIVSDYIFLVSDEVTASCFETLIGNILESKLLTRPLPK